MNRERMHSMIDLLLDMRESLAVKHAMPPEAAAHFRQAKREALLGVRSLVDHALAKVDAEGQPASQAEEGPKAIPVE